MVERTAFEGAAPILPVSNMKRAVQYYVARLGFQEADWGTDGFTSLKRDRAGLYLCAGSQGCSGTWAWIGVEDVQLLYQEYTTSAARVRHAPRNYPWALEMHVEDLDGHVLRFGSEPLAGRPFDDWAD